MEPVPEQREVEAGGSWWCLLVRGAPLASYGLVRPGFSLLQRLFAVVVFVPMCLSSVSRSTAYVLSLLISYERSIRDQRYLISSPVLRSDQIRLLGFTTLHGSTPTTEPRI
jgi:hypothetical protein